MGGGAFTYLHGDHLGSTVTTTSGTTGTQERYHAYGATRSGGITATDYQYTGQFSDNVTGLIYMNARYYDPSIGQFISPDTIVPDPTNLFDYNRYMYVRGNPLKYSDPSGHCALSLAGGPAFVAVDIGCWSMPVGPIIAGGVLLAGAGIYGYTLTTPEIPSYPPPTLTGNIADIQESYPLGNTVSSPIIGGIQMGGTDPTGAAVDSALPDGGINVVADPLGQGVDASPYLTTQNTYRAGLAARVPIPAAGGPYHAHHMLPIKSAQEFANFGIANVHDPKYLAWVNATWHLQSKADYQRDWDKFFAEYDGEMTPGAIEAEAARLAGKYGYDWK